jgi:DNA-binding transcriptional regulator YdaS (Cro superfamily)
MSILEYCKQERITLIRFANLIGYEYGTIRNWSSGDARPGIKACMRIEKITNGKISLKDLRSDLIAETKEYRNSLSP